jgi:lipopolysaccharide export system ATP-binding protein
MASDVPSSSAGVNDLSLRLVAKGLKKRFRKRTVVNRIGFHVSPGEVVGLLGPNGAGKTTSFNMVAGLVKSDEGQVFLGPTEITHFPLHRRARAGLGYLPQEASIFRKLTVRENLLAILEFRHRKSAAELRQQADSVLAEFKLSHVADSLGETLSGGERRRAEIARSLLHEPKFILFDEPFAGVDPIHVAELQKEIASLKQRGIGVLITDHNVRDTLRICDRAYILVDGTILEEGTPATLAGSSSARRSYLGQDFAL